jgi:protein-disulfide isomerase
MARRVEGVKDPELKAALARLGTRIAAGRRSVLAGAAAGLLAPILMRRSEAQPAGAPAADGKSIPPQPEFSEAQKKLLTVRPTDHVLGKASAPIAIIDYFSLTCPHCANFHAAILPSIRSEWTDTGRACFIYRHWPFDTIATHASQLTECAGSARFYDTIDILFRQQVEWLTAPDPDEEMVRILEKQGIKAGGCYAQDQLLDKVIDDVQSGQALGVKFTPTVFVNRLYAGSPNTAEGMNAILLQAAR